MKRKYTFLSIGITTIAIAGYSLFNLNYSTHSYAFHSGSPGGKTNSPLDGNNCTQCHTGTNNTEIKFLLDQFLDGKYEPGKTYAMNFSIDGSIVNPLSGKNGFEFSAEANNTKVGTYTIVDANKTKLTNSGNAVTHTNASGDGTVGWFFQWTAPPAGTGDITLHMAGLVSNGDGATSGDNVNDSSYVITELIGNSIKEINKDAYTIYPSPARIGESIFLSNDENTPLESATIYTIDGKQVTQFNTQSTLSSIQLEEAGTYIIQLINKNNQVITKKIIVR